MRPPRKRAALLGGMAALVLASACSGSGSGAKEAKNEPVTTAAPTTVLAPTTTVAASPRTLVTLPTELGPGPANVAGTVTGPEGLIPGATVRVERLLDDNAVAATTVQTGADGRWAVDSVNGGRYRLRAWRPPDLTQLLPVVAFVTVDESKPIDLPVLRYPGTGNAVANVLPNPPVVGQGAILVVGAASGDVDSEGVLHSGVRPGLSVTLALSTNVVITTPNPVGTDENGNAGFQIVCNQPGPITAMAVVGTAPQQLLQVPPCSAA